MTIFREQQISILEQTYPALSQLAGDLSETALDFRGDSSDWTVREILAHLVDDEMFVMRTRLERIVVEDQPHLTPFDEKKWYGDRNKNRDKVTELLQDFLAQRTASLGIIKKLQVKDWDKTGFQPEIGHFTAEKWLERWARHDLTHLNQIEETLEKAKKTAG